MLNKLQRLKEPCLNWFKNGIKNTIGWMGQTLIMVSLSGRLIRQIINSSKESFSLSEISIKQQNEMFGIPLAIISALVSPFVIYKNKKNGNTSFEAKLRALYTGLQLLFIADVLLPGYINNMSFWTFISVFPTFSLLNYKFSSGATIVNTDSTFQCIFSLNRMNYNNEDNQLAFSQSKCRKIIEVLGCGLHAIHLTMGIVGLPISVFNKQIHGGSTELKQQESIVISVFFFYFFLLSANMNRFPKTYYYTSALENAGKSLSLIYDGFSGIAHLFLFFNGYYDCGNENNDNCGDSDTAIILATLFILAALIMAILAFCRTGFDFNKNFQQKQIFSQKVNHYWGKLAQCTSSSFSWATTFCCNEDDSDESMPLNPNEHKKSITINESTSVNFQL